MTMRLAVFASFVLWVMIPAGAFAQTDGTETDSAHLPRPVSIYTEQSAEGIPVRLNYFAPSGGPFVVFAVGDRDRPAEHLPPLDEQGQILDHLLGRLFEEHPDLPPAFPFFLGESRESLIESLDKKLREPGADWDAKRGRPVHGQFGAVLMAELDKALQSSPIAKAFETHGYVLVLEAISRIDIEPLKDAGGGRFPKYIDTMNIHATKANSKE